mgnify:CR=1 FL=1
MNGYLIALIVFVAWIALIYALHKSKWLERHNMSLYGPMIMWKTTKGKDFIDRLASRKTFWKLYGMASLWICAVAMGLITLLLLWEATIVPQIEEAPAPELILGIPGLNPVIPLGYGILGLVIAIVVHEMSHGVMTRLGGMKVMSMGVVFLVFPAGAFVEPDEHELRSTTRAKRSKVYAAGPASNILLSLIILGLFSGVMMSSVEPVHDGALTTGVVAGSPAEIAGISPTSVVVSIGGSVIASASDFEDRTASSPGTNVTVEYYFKGELRSAEVMDGVVVAYVAEGFAAYEGGIRTGMVLVSVDGSTIDSTEALSEEMLGKHAGQTVTVVVMSYSDSAGAFVVDTSITVLTLSDKWDYYEEYDPDNNDPSYQGIGYLGGGFLSMGLRTADADYYSAVLSRPFEGDSDLSDFSNSWLRLIALPFLDLAPLRSPVTDLYEPSGWFAWMPDSAFWLLTNSFYWIFWLNLMIGLTNVLPAVPLDGGYLFRDAFDYLVDRKGTKYTKEKREQLVGTISIAFALLILALILWQLVGPALW